MKNLRLYIPITKVDEAKRLVYGIATAELPDSVGEICDYETTVPYYKAWSDRIHKASDGKSKGNLRAMHDKIAAGKITQIEFNDAEKQIEICAKVVDDDEWKKVAEGVYTGFSQGGSYIKTWKDGDYTRYTANPSEVSLVDNPCLPTATFTMVRADGATELRKFKMEKNMKLHQVWQADDGSTYPSKAEAIKKNEELKVELLSKKATDGLDEINKELKKTESEKEDDKEKDEIKKEELTDEEKKKEEEDKKKKEAESETEKAAKIDLKKWLCEDSWDAKMALEALISIQMLCEKEMTEDEPEQVNDLKEVITRLKSFISSEIQEEDEVDKVASGELNKAGARHSKADLNHITKAHEAATQISKHAATIHECMKGLGMEGTDEEEDGEDGDDHDKASQSEELQKSKAAEVALTKTIASLTDTIESVSKRVKELELQPAPSKATIFRVEKGHEVTEAEKTPVEVGQSQFMPDRTSPEDFRKSF